MATFDPAVIVSALAPWVSTQRWFSPQDAAASDPAGTGEPSWRLLAWVPVRNELVAAIVEHGSRRYHVPVVLTTAPHEGHIGEIIDDAGVCHNIADATANHLGRSLLIQALGEPAPTTTELLDVEQSNTSLTGAYPTTGPAPLFVKVMRVIPRVPSPEAEVLATLTDRECPGTPRLRGVLRTEIDGNPCDLALGTTFAPTLSDAWTALAEEFESEIEHGMCGLSDMESDDLAELFWHPDPHRVAAFTRETLPSLLCVYRLGQLLRTLHTHLADAYGTRPASDGRRHRLASVWVQRANEAASVLRSLGMTPPSANELSSIWRRAAEHDSWPPLQRIHGDLHLG